MTKRPLKFSDIPYHTIWKTLAPAAQHNNRYPEFKAEIQIQLKCPHDIG